jgi:hypothetical protein
MKNTCSDPVGLWFPLDFRYHVLLCVTALLASLIPQNALADRAQPESTKTQFTTPLPAAPEIVGGINVEEWQSANAPVELAPIL